MEIILVLFFSFVALLSDDDVFVVVTKSIIWKSKFF